MLSHLHFILLSALNKLLTTLCKSIQVQQSLKDVRLPIKSALHYDFGYIFIGPMP